MSEPVIVQDSRSTLEVSMRGDDVEINSLKGYSFLRFDKELWPTLKREIEAAIKGPLNSGDKTDGS